MEPGQRTAGMHMVPQQGEALAISDEESRKKYVCELCGKRFQRYSRSQPRIQYLTKFATSSDRAASKTTSIPTRVKSVSHTLRLRSLRVGSHARHTAHICPHPGCNKRFSTKSNMKRHAATHEDLDEPHPGTEDTSVGTSEQAHGGASQFAGMPAAGPSTHAGMQMPQAGMAGTTGPFTSRAPLPPGQAQAVPSQSGQPTRPDRKDAQHAGMSYK